MEFIDSLIKSIINKKQYKCTAPDVSPLPCYGKQNMVCDNTCEFYKLVEFRVCSNKECNEIGLRIELMTGLCERCWNLMVKNKN